MKKVMFAIMALVFSASVVGAATIQAFGVKTSIITVDDQKVKIKPEELPDAVKTALKGQDYTGWEINSAYKFSESGTYEVELKKAAETKTVKFDKDGKAID
jgi:hypothetical protein